MQEIQSGLEVTALSKRFRETVALSAVDLRVATGEIMVLLGPNGAGKTTLIRILGTTVLPDAGSVFIAGVDALARPRQARRATGLVLGDERSFYWRLSGTQNLLFFSALHGFDKRSARKRSHELLERFGLEEAADHPYSTYSSGMKARLSLARALLAQPQVLLLDEPTSNLDPLAAAEFRRSIRDLTAETGASALWATHDLHEASTVADRVSLMVKGRLNVIQDDDTSPAALETALEQATSQ